MAQIKITALPIGIPKGTDETPAVDITDTSSASTGKTKKYMRSDELNFYLGAQGLTTYSSVVVATTIALTAVYVNGTLGVGATLTNASFQSALTIDGVLQVVGNRVLVKDQVDQLQNGIYVVSVVGDASTNWIMTRATDYDQPLEIVQYGVVLADQGFVSAGLLYQESGAGPFFIGTTPITFILYSTLSGLTGVASAQGTADQILVNDTSGMPIAGTLIFTLPQNISASSSPTFTELTLTAGLSASGLVESTGNSLISGSSQGGFNGSLVLWPTTSSSGSLTLVTPSNAGDFANTLSNAPTTAARAWILPDSSGTLAMASQLPIPSALTEINDTNVTMTLGGSPATALLQDVSMTLGWTGQLAVGRGGTGVSSVTTVPVATAFAGWDANLNFAANSLTTGYATTLTAAGTTTLTVSSAQQQFFTGTTTQTVVMPVTSTVTLGFSYLIVNNSTGIVTVQSSGLNNIVAIAANTQSRVTCILTSGTTAASWSADNSASVAGVSSITGTTNQVIASAATGNVTLSLPQSIATSSSPTFNNLTLTGGTISGVNGNPVVSLVDASGGVNYLAVSNAVGNPIITVVGTATNPGLNIFAKGAGGFFLFTLANSPIQFGTGTAYQHNTIFSFANTAATQTVSFPDATGTLLMTGVAINSVPSITFSSTSGIIGTITNNNAASGSVGEYASVIVNSGSAVSLTTGITSNVALMNLTQGDWEVFGYVAFTGTAIATSGFSAGISQTSATLPSRTAILDSESSAVIAVSSSGFATVGQTIIALTPTRISIATGAVVTQCLVAQLSFSGGTGTAYGTIRARRIR